MAIFRRFCPILFLLLWGGGQLLHAATREDKIYTQAVTAFGESNWDRAQMLFAQFADKYANSTNVPEAVLLQSQSLFQLGRYDATISLLNNLTNLARAKTVNLADQYVYWTAEAHYRSGQYQQAADTFISLTTNFPNSYLRLRSLIEAVAAYGQLGNWSQVVTLLESPGGVFAKAQQQNPADELVVRGELFLAQARFMQKDLGAAMIILDARDPQTINLPALGWGWAFLRFKLNVGSTNLAAALSDTTNMLAVARVENDATNLAEATALQAGLLEQTGRPADAMAVYQMNLAANVPGDRQRQAVLKIAELAVKLGQIAYAEQALDAFLFQYTNSPASDQVLLKLGELHLLNFTTSAVTNDLLQAEARLEQLTNDFGSSPLVGKAYLDLGWCNWLSRRIPENPDDSKISESYANFKMAAEKLTTPDDTAIARFKMGDALLILTNYPEAVANYQSVLKIAETEPVVEEGLAERALYQMLRAELAIPNLAGANDALKQLQQKFPLGNAAQSSLLLYGENLPQPAEARQLFESYQSHFTNSALLPRLQIAIARTYELEGQWYTAMTNYYSWLAAFPTNTSLRPQVEYSLANATYQLGNEPTAMLLFTNFVATYPTNDLAPLAQYWVADAYFRQGNWRLAELSYQMIYQNQNLARPGSPLFYEAELMAGQAAMGRAGYHDASNYFTTLLNDITNCPPDLAVQARFAYGNALMLIDSSDTNNPYANFQRATNIFAEIPPTNEVGFMALGLIAECDYTMGDYLSATNNYSRVADAADVSVSVRSQARVGLGLTLEKLAQQDGSAASSNLLNSALNQYLDVFDTQFGDNNPFWVKKAGLQALTLMQSLGAADSNKFIDRMEQLFPQSRDSLEKRRLPAPVHPPPLAGG
jgi:TolA-binding protein